MHSNRTVKHANWDVPAGGTRRSALVWAVSVIGVVAVLGIVGFFMLPSRVFGLPDSGTSEDVVTDDATEDEKYSADDFGGGTPDIAYGETDADSPLLTVEPTRATAGQPYNGTVGSTYIDIARCCLFNLGWFDDYVFWRSGEYQYTFAYGNIDYSSGTFTSTSCTQLTISVPTTYTGSVTVSDSTGSLNLQTGGRLVYSNLGNLPHLDSRKYLYDEVMYIGMVALGLHVLSSASRFILRSGRAA